MREHELNETEPIIEPIIDRLGNTVIAEIDYPNATPNTIDLVFYEPVAGSAMVRR
jgi:hypothetical protein